LTFTINQYGPGFGYLVGKCVRCGVSHFPALASGSAPIFEAQTLSGSSRCHLPCFCANPTFYHLLSFTVRSQWGCRAVSCNGWTRPSKDSHREAWSLVWQWCAAGWGLVQSGEVLEVGCSWA
jgi:hypothetical protein